MTEGYLIVGTDASRSPSVRRSLQEAVEFLSRSGIESARIDAELLLAVVVGQKREELYLDPERSLEGDQQQRYRSLLGRRAGGEPVAYIRGRREFWSLDFIVTPDVLIPRPETELLVETVLGLVEDQSKIANRRFQILDLGTGSGNIAISLAKERDDAEVWATDLSVGALQVAAANARRHDVERRVRFAAGDAFEPVTARREFFHMIVSNPPYVRRGEIPALLRDVREWEPVLALDGGLDGLDFYRRIATEGHRYLKDGGFLILEIGDDMGEKVLGLLSANGLYSAGSLRRDYSGKERIIVAQKRRAAGSKRG